jgi:peptidoglycan/LPS O-acetylase OafA/YrhL
VGLFRILLALSVVIGHSSPIFGERLIFPSVAVQAFYIVSGFYMTLILNEKYVGPGSYGRFISNRFLRLFPVYWIVVALTVIFLGVQYHLGHRQLTDHFTASWGGLTWGSRATLVFMNLAIFFQDLTLYLGLDTSAGTLYFTGNIWATEPKVQNFLLVPQAWSLSLELLFYAIAPFIVRRGVRVVAALAAASLCVRWALASHGYGFDPWTYRFFPNELALFLFGGVSYYLMRIIRGRRWAWIYSACAAAAVLAAFVELPYEWSLDNHSAVWCFYALVTAAVPGLFLLTRKTAVDRFIGELSYPIYLVHILVIWVLDAWGVVPGNYRGIAVAAAAVALSSALYVAVIRPVERIRAARVKGISAAGKAPLAAVAGAAPDAAQ